MTDHNKLPKETSIANVHLGIKDMQRSLEYYQKGLGFQVHKLNGQTAHLGAGKDDLLILEQIPDAVRVHGHTGLYHFAILLPSRLELAKMLKHIVESGTHIDGASDHLVSEALYLSDPDGNGIEIYRDRPRSEWPFDVDQIRMAVDPLDMEGILAELGNDRYEWQGMPAETYIGHMHLRVARTGEAEEFYTQVIGMDLMARYGTSASFLSAGGYHHHIGINNWESRNAPPPPKNAVGLISFSIKLPDKTSLVNLNQRIIAAGINCKFTDGSLSVRDPSNNGIEFITQETENVE